MDLPRIAIIGGGPAGLFALKHLTESSIDATIEIFEKSDRLGAGMPYSLTGAGREHITNVSGNEIPELPQTFLEWLSDKETRVKEYGLEMKKITEYTVIPRLLFGEYLEAQFLLVIERAETKGIGVTIHKRTAVKDILDLPGSTLLTVIPENGETRSFSSVIVCTGHLWPHAQENKTGGFFESPYPPSKIASDFNHAVGIRGASLTAIDAVRTLARHHGKFFEADAELAYEAFDEFPEFKIALHSRSGLLPAIRFHLEDSQLGKDRVLSEQQIEQQRNTNGGFLPLDYVYEEIFLGFVKEKDPEYFSKIESLSLEEFVGMILEFRDDFDPFFLFEAEYQEAAKSIERHRSVIWKEGLAVLSFAINYPAKYFSAEDMLRLQKTLMPLISLIIAFVPQSSSRELLALYRAGKLHMIPVGSDSHVRPLTKGAEIRFSNNTQEHRLHYDTFIDCIGQPHLPFEKFPFEGLKQTQAVSPAFLQFRSPEKGKVFKAQGSAEVIENRGEYFLKVPGVSINDNFQACDFFGAIHPGLFIMAVPHIGGLNPDYSGLDFCDAAAKKVSAALGKHLNTN